ncbi:MAG: pyruvate kinase [Clostridia bacterium]|nr:pyruvate kinase [Clostridia bacterium]
MKKTKIIATLGPASANPKVLKEMIDNGLNVARINFSHGTTESNQANIDLIKSVRTKLNVPLSIMVDTRGPEVRVKTFEDGCVHLNKGQTFSFWGENKLGNSSGVAITEPSILPRLQIGDTILANDGLISLKVISKDNNLVTTKVITGGKLSDNKGLTFKDFDLKLPYISDRDKKDLIWAFKNKCDYVACSFVTCKQDIIEVRKLMEKYKHSCKIIAKIESSLGIKNLVEILDACDGVMVARGDLGVEYAVSKLPSLQSNILKTARDMHKISIVATEMLESMIHNPRPTRAEVSDVANAIREGAGAIMLSAETSVGEYPSKAVKTMCDISLETEKELDYESLYSHTKIKDTIANITTTMAIKLTHKLPTKAIAICTSKGKMATYVATSLPKCDIYAITNNQNTYYQMGLLRGVLPIYLPKFDETQIFSNINDELLSQKLVKKSDNIVLVTGTTDEFSNVVKINTIN